MTVKDIDTQRLEKNARSNDISASAVSDLVNLPVQANDKSTSVNEKAITQQHLHTSD